MSGHLIPLAVALPLLAATTLAIIGDRALLRRAILLCTLAAVLGLEAALLALTADGDVVATAIGGWPGDIAINFAVDTFGALVLTATGLLALICTCFAVIAGDDRHRMFAPLVLILTAGAAGAAATADLFNLFVFIELMLMPSYALLSMSRDPARVRAARLYLSVSLLASTGFLIGVGLVYGSEGTTNLAALTGSAADSPATAVAGAALLTALAVKAALAPVHGWLARTYPHASPAVTALFSALHTKIALYAVYRLHTLMFDGDAEFAWLAVAVCAASMAVGALGALGERSMRPILAVSMVSHNGYIALGAFLGPLGLAAGVFYLMHDMVVKTSLFLTAGAIETRYGTGRLRELGGLARREPLVAAAFMIAALSLAGVPPFSGFIAKFVLVRAAVAEGPPYAAAVAVAVAVLTLAAMARIWRGVFVAESPADAKAHTGQREDGHHLPPRSWPFLTDISLRMATPGLVLAVLTVVLGLWGNGLLILCERAGEGLADYSNYTEAVIDR